MVDLGTAEHRVREAFLARKVALFGGGKKNHGTGDQRFDTYGAGGRLLESRVVNRSARSCSILTSAFWHLIAYVPGSKAAGRVHQRLAGSVAESAGALPHALIGGTPAAEGLPGGCLPATASQ